MANAPDGRKVKATIHWVAATTRSTPRCASTTTCSLPRPASADGGDFPKLLNPNSKKVVRGKLEPSLRDAQGGERFQFERVGYFYCDHCRQQAGRPAIFHRTVGNSG